MAILVCVIGTSIFLLAIHYLKSTTEMLNKEWDVDTVTAADYTVVMDISQGMFDQYMKLRDENRE